MLSCKVFEDLNIGFEVWLRYCNCNQDIQKEVEERIEQLLKDKVKAK